MDQVSCFTLGLHRRVAQLRGIPLAELLDGTGVTPDDAARTGYLPWASFVKSLERLEEIVGPHEALAELGLEVSHREMHGPYFELLGHMMSVRLLYRAATRWSAPRLFPCIHMHYDEVSQSEVRMDVEIPPPLVGSRPFLWLNAGVLRGLPRFLQLPDAEVAAEISTERSARYVVRLPTQTTWRTHLRGAARFLRASHQVVEELAIQNDLLRHETLALHAARAEAEQARQVAERAMSVRRELIELASHEMRTPLNSLLLSTEMLGDISHDERAQAHIEMLRQSARRLTSSLDELLGLDAYDVPPAVETPSTTGEPARADASPSRLARVLLVEDDELTHRVMRLVLESLGCELDGAHNGIEAFERCWRARYDLVLMDCQMPEMGGLDATRAIRAAHGPSRDAFIVGLTAGVGPQSATWQAAGMDALLHKPVEPAALSSLLRAVRERAGAGAAQAQAAS